MKSGRRNERGSALMLMPAATLIALILAALAIDAAATAMRQRELFNAADAAANDAATAAIDQATLRATGEIRLDPERAQAVAAESLEAQRLRIVGAPVVEVLDGRTVRVVVRARSPRVIARGLPDLDFTVTATATAYDPLADRP